MTIQICSICTETLLPNKISLYGRLGCWLLLHLLGLTSLESIWYSFNFILAKLGHIWQQLQAHLYPLKGKVNPEGSIKLTTVTKRGSFLLSCLFTGYICSFEDKYTLLLTLWLGLIFFAWWMHLLLVKCCLHNYRFLLLQSCSHKPTALKLGQNKSPWKIKYQSPAGKYVQ